MPISSLLMDVGINHYLVLSALLFTMGMIGVLMRKNVIVILMSIELMLNVGITHANILICIFDIIVHSKLT